VPIVIQQIEQSSLNRSILPSLRVSGGERAVSHPPLGKTSGHALDWGA
jgi:hypothetical protein